jgi:hypothetical protein
VIRIVLYSGAPETPTGDGSSGSARPETRVYGSQDVVRGRLVQRLVVRGYSETDSTEIRDVLCRLLLDGFAVRASSADAVGIGRTDVSVPDWLVVGIAENLDPASRAENSRTVLLRWRQGGLAPLADLLWPRSGGSGTTAGLPGRMGAGDRDLYRSVCGVFVSWLLDRPEKEPVLVRLFERVGTGGTISPAWMAEQILGSRDPRELDEAWDRWVLRQKRIIYDPRSAARLGLELLREELLICRRDFDIRSASDPYEMISFRELIAERDAPGISNVCRRKSLRLQVLAVGRGRKFADVIGLYCRFLETLPKDAAPGHLHALLDDADRALETLAQDLEIRSAAGR